MYDTSSHQAAADLRFLRLPEVRARTGLGKTTIYRLIQKGQFPEPTKVGARVSLWPDSAIRAWQEKAIGSEA